MKEKLNNIIKLLLELHKNLLDLERATYEKKNGPISNNHEYFQLVINHDDFCWLRALSKIITVLDEAAEQTEIDNKQVVGLLIDLQKLLQGSLNENFFKRYQYFSNQDQNLSKLENRILASILDISK